MKYMEYFVAGILIYGSITVMHLYYRKIMDKEKGKFFSRLFSYQPRTDVPWSGRDVLFLVGVYIFLIFFASFFTFQFPFSQIFPELARNRPSLGADDLKEHAITQLILLGGEIPLVLGLTFLIAVIIVPIGEEFLFRVLFQGYMEKREKTLRRGNMFRFRRFLPRAFLSVLVPALIFAMLHLRSAEPRPQPLERLFATILALGAIYVFFVPFSIAYLKTAKNATFSDLGLRVDTFFHDCVIGAIAGLLLVPPVQCFTVGIKILLKEIVSASVLDPAPLFLFALGLGILYFRTHRIVPGLVLHVLLNGFSFTLLYFFVR